MHLDDDVDGELGPLDEFALDEIRNVFDRQDSLVSEAGFQDLVDPRDLKVYFDDGIGEANYARFDVKWFRSGYYCFHHTDPAGQDFRWDFHPKDGAPAKHFHPPATSGTADPEPSCITVEQPELVARAVHRLWRRAFDTGRLDDLNTAENPP